MENKNEPLFKEILMMATDAQLGHPAIHRITETLSEIKGMLNQFLLSEMSITLTRSGNKINGVMKP
jgi:hypothetical protein